MNTIWIEIKRFLKDYKKVIFIGVIIIAFLFTVLFSIFDLRDDQSQGKEEEITSQKIFKDTDPAYFQVFIEYEDGLEFGNSSIVQDYFTLNSVKEDLKKETNVDIDAIKAELEVKEKDEAKVVDVDRDNSSYLWTAAFNTGKESDNLTIAQYYYDLLVKDEVPFLEDKVVYSFEEPRMAADEGLLTEAEEKEEVEESFNQSTIKVFVKNGIIGAVLGIVAMIGLLLLKVIYGKKLEYSFAYDLAEEESFILSDPEMNNKDLLDTFLTATGQDQKVVLAEQALTDASKERLTRKKELAFTEEAKMQLLEYPTFSEIEQKDSLGELIIIVQPKETSRAWYKKQLKFAEIQGLPVKVVQINE